MATVAARKSLLRQIEKERGSKAVLYAVGDREGRWRFLTLGRPGALPLPPGGISTPGP